MIALTKSLLKSRPELTYEPVGAWLASIVAAHDYAAKHKQALYCPYGAKHWYEMSLSVDYSDSPYDLLVSISVGAACLSVPMLAMFSDFCWQIDSNSLLQLPPQCKISDIFVALEWLTGRVLAFGATKTEHIARLPFFNGLPPTHGVDQRRPRHYRRGQPLHVPN